MNTQDWFGIENKIAANDMHTNALIGHIIICNTIAKKRVYCLDNGVFNEGFQTHFILSIIQNKISSKASSVFTIEILRCLFDVILVIDISLKYYFQVIKDKYKLNFKYE